MNWQELARKMEELVRSEDSHEFRTIRLPGDSRARYGYLLTWLPTLEEWFIADVDSLWSGRAERLAIVRLGGESKDCRLNNLSLAQDRKEGYWIIPANRIADARECEVCWEQEGAAMRMLGFRPPGEGLYLDQVKDWAVSAGLTGLSKGFGVKAEGSVTLHNPGTGIYTVLLCEDTPENQSRILAAGGTPLSVYHGGMNVGKHVRPL